MSVALKSLRFVVPLFVITLAATPAVAAAQNATDPVTTRDMDDDDGFDDWGLLGLLGLAGLLGRGRREPDRVETRRT